MYKDGSWGVKAKERSKKRNEYFRNYRRLHRIGENLKETKICTKHIGCKGEKLALQILEGSEKSNSQSFDVLWNKSRVDVKTSIPLPFRNKKRWKFSLARQKGKVDYFLLCLLTEKKTLDKVYLIPDIEIQTKNITILSNTPTKYHPYLMSLF